MSNVVTNLLCNQDMLEDVDDANTYDKEPNGNDKDKRMLVKRIDEEII